ncbi:Cytochrome P450 67, partial [Leucoagaricus sp. SymC.cos]
HLAFQRDETLHLPRILNLLLGVPTAVYTFFGDKSQGVTYGFLRNTCGFYATIALSILFYRLSPRHPIAGYPGPFLCKITKIYWAAITRNGEQHKILAALHERYGEVVRIGPNEVSIASASAVDPLMGSPGQPKGQFWEGRRPLNSPPNLVGLRNKKEHVRRRKTWQRALNVTSIKYYENFVITRTQQMVDLLGQKLSGPIDMSEWMGYYTFDLMGDLVFGEGPEMMKNGDSDNLWHLLEESQKTLFFFGMVPWLGKLMLGVGQVMPLVPGIKKYREYTVGRVIKRKEGGSLNKDLFHYLVVHPYFFTMEYSLIQLKMDEDGVLEQKPTNAEIFSDSALAIIAGADTTTSALTSILYFLMRYPNCYRRVQEEIDSLGSGLMDTEKQAKLVYLNAAINEALRLLPPVQSGSQREIQRGTGATMVEQYLLPEGTVASVAFRLVHRDHRNFAPYPEMFLPERWLSEEVRESLEPDIFNDKNPFNLNQSAFLAFSHGPANCLGKQLAYVKMRVAICALLHRYALKFAPGYNPLQYEEDYRDYYIVVKGPLPVILTPR